MQTEMKTTIEESRLVQEKYKTLLEQARTDLARRMAENDDLKGRVGISWNVGFINFIVLTCSGWCGIGDLIRC